MEEIGESGATTAAQARIRRRRSSKSDKAYELKLEQVAAGADALVVCTENGHKNSDPAESQRYKLKEMRMREI